MRDFGRHARLAVWLLLWGAAFAGACGRRPPAAVASTTVWQLEPSLKYDALCLLNALSGDPY